MISIKGKHRLKYEGISYYWPVRKDSAPILRIHIISEDKALQRTFCFGREIGIGTQYVKKLLEMYREEKQRS